MDQKQAAPFRILYFSDIHIEIRESETRVGWIDTYPLDLGPDLSDFPGTVDLAILAGDIGTIRPTRGVSAQVYAEQVSAYLGCPVVLVPGNHEYYGGVFRDDRESLLAENRPGVSFLDRGVAYFSGAGGILRILGATLWTDYEAAGEPEAAMALARNRINDHRLIRIADVEKFRPEDALSEHRKSRAWLFDRLREEHDGRTIVVTHHVPSLAARHPGYSINDPLLPIFCSDCEDLIKLASEKSVSNWIFGHHHHCIDVEVCGVRLVSAQLGYPRERTGWRGPGFIELRP